MWGIDEEAITDSCETYILVGNNEVHKHKSTWSRLHTKTEPDCVFSRATNGSADFVTIWNSRTEQPITYVIYRLFSWSLAKEWQS